MEHLLTRESDEQNVSIKAHFFFPALEPMPWPFRPKCSFFFATLCSSEPIRISARISKVSQVWCRPSAQGHQDKGSGSIQFTSAAQSCPTLCDPMDCSTLGLPVHHQLPELTQTQVHWVGDAIQPSHPLSSPSPPAFNLSQHQGLFQWVSSLHQVAKVLEFQHQFFQWIFRTDFL